jgi:hypothetical protein
MLLGCDALASALQQIEALVEGWSKGSIASIWPREDATAFQSVAAELSLAMSHLAQQLSSASLPEDVRLDVAHVESQLASLNFTEEGVCACLYYVVAS